MGDIYNNINDSIINNRSKVNENKKEVNERDKDKNDFIPDILKEELKELISENNIAECINRISENISAKLSQKKLIHIKSQYYRLQEEQMLNIVTHNEYNLNLNKINLSMLNFIETYL